MVSDSTSESNGLELTLVCAPGRIRTYTALGSCIPKGSGATPAPSYQLRHEGINQNKTLDSYSVAYPGQDSNLHDHEGRGNPTSLRIPIPPPGHNGPVIQPLALIFFCLLYKKPLIAKVHHIGGRNSWLRSGIPFFVPLMDLAAFFQPFKRRPTGPIHLLEVRSGDALNGFPENICAPKPGQFFDNVLDYLNGRFRGFSRFLKFIHRMRGLKPNRLDRFRTPLARRFKNAVYASLPAGFEGLLLKPLNEFDDIGNFYHAMVIFAGWQEFKPLFNNMA